MLTKKFNLIHATQRGDYQAVVKLVSQIPSADIHYRNYNHWNALDHAAFYGFDKIVALLLATNPKLPATVAGGKGKTALHHAAENGHGRVVTQLLESQPQLALAVDSENRTALHLATQMHHEKVAAQLLDACPSLIDAMDCKRWVALHHACYWGDEALTELFLNIKPELAFATDRTGNTPLHLAAIRTKSPMMIKRLLQVNPSALLQVNKDKRTPFHLAVGHNNDVVIGEMQSSCLLSVEDVLNILGANHEKFKQFRLVVEVQCESLQTTLLNRDVASVVFEYLGFVHEETNPSSWIEFSE